MTRKVKSRSVPASGISKTVRRPTRHREVENEPEGGAEHRAQATEKRHVRTTDVVREIELARVDALDDADDRSESAGGDAAVEVGVRVDPGQRYPPAPEEREQPERGGDGGHGSEVHDLGLAVRGSAVVRHRGVDSVLLLLQNTSGPFVGSPRVDEAQKVRSRGHHELQTDATTNPAEDLRCTDRKLVAAVDLLSDVRIVLRRPVARTAETSRAASGTRKPPAVVASR